jgi:chorismate mutase
MVASLVRRSSTSEDPGFQELIENYRQQIDEFDEEIIHLIAQRMHLVREIGYVKKDKNVAIFQPERWRALAEACRSRAEKGDLSREFISLFLEAIHQEGINQQERIMIHSAEETTIAGDLWMND